VVCPPKLLIFDLKNNNLIERILIPPHIANNENNTGLLVTPLVYVQDCKHINDATVSSIFSDSFVFSHNSMYLCSLFYTRANVHHIL